MDSMKKNSVVEDWKIQDGDYRRDFRDIKKLQRRSRNKKIIIRTFLTLLYLCAISLITYFIIS